jgi:hypothetical protein
MTAYTKSALEISQGGCDGRSDCSRGEVITEHVVEKQVVAAAGNFPILRKTNYYDWAALMHMMLQARAFGMR